MRLAGQIQFHTSSSTNREQLGVFKEVFITGYEKILSLDVLILSLRA